MQVICWVLGEYGTASGVTASEVIDQLCSLVETQNVSDTVRGVMLTAFGKLASHFGQRLTPAAEEIQHSASLSANPDLQQRALELQALLRSVTCLLIIKYSIDMFTSFVSFMQSQANEFHTRILGSDSYVDMTLP